MSNPATTLSAHANGLKTKLRQLRSALVRWMLAEGLARIVLLVAAACLLDFLIDRNLRMDSAQRLVMLVLLALGFAWACWRFLLQPLAARVTDDALCLEIEKRRPGAGEKLISAIEFTRMDWSRHENVSLAMVDQTVREGEALGRDFPEHSILRGDRFRFNKVVLLVAGFGLLGTVGYGILRPSSSLAIWFNRNVLLGHAQWPQDHNLVIVGAEGGSLAIPKGDDWPLTTRVLDGYVSLPKSVRMEYRTERGVRVETMEDIDEGREFRVSLPAVSESFECRVVTDKFTSEWVTAILLQRPEIVEVELTVRPPSYTGNGAEKLPPGSGPYSLLDGSSLEIGGRASKPLASAVLVAGETRLPLPLTGESSFTGLVPSGHVVSGTYWIEVEDTETIILPGNSEPTGLGAREPARFKVRVRPDAKPSVTASLEGVSGLVVANARVPYLARAEDDYAVKNIRVEYGWKDDSGEAEEKTGQLEPAGEPLESATDRIAYASALELEPLNIAVNSRLSLRITAEDNDTVNGPKKGESNRLLLRVVSEGDLRADLLRREKEQRQLLEELLKKQDELLTDCQAAQAEVRGAETLASEGRDLLVRLQKRQKQLGANLFPLVERMTGMVAEMENNRLEDEQGVIRERILSNVVKPLSEAYENLSPLAVIALDNARRAVEGWEARNAHLNETVALQQQVMARMREAMIHMVKNEDFQIAVNLLYEIQKSQRELKKMTEAEKEARIKEILEKEPGGPPGNVDSPAPESP